MSSSGWVTIGRPAASGRQLDKRRRECDARFGVGGWRIVHQWGDHRLLLAEVGRLFEDSYVAFFASAPDVLDWLCAAACDVYENAHSNVRSELDYSVQERRRPHVYDIALRNALKRLGRCFAGTELLAFCGPRQLSLPISPGRVPFVHYEHIHRPALEGWWLPNSLECFLRSNRVLEVRQAGSEVLLHSSRVIVNSFAVHPDATAR